MKRFALIITAALISIACESDNDKVIRFSELPAQSQQFINTHFSEKQISVIYYDDDLFDEEYRVIFSDGAKIEFNKKGSWKEIKDKDADGIPQDVIHESILSFVRKNHPENYIVKISKERKEYETELNNTVEIVFDRNGNFKRYDD
ncbi:MAG: PepSY-like domain-containing protein [Bacteroidales bacterium]|nr:PepSY-like domain-containing protein [Bacteroidales bacterium]